MHLNYASNFIAARARTTSAKALNDANFEPKTASQAGLVLYPHFQKSVVPGWLDKGLKWRHKATPFLSNMVLLAPNPGWVKTLPNAKLPDRQDFKTYGTDLQARVKAWEAAASASERLADEWQHWLRKPDISLIESL